MTCPSIQPCKWGARSQSRPTYPAGTPPPPLWGRPWPGHQLGGSVSPHSHCPLDCQPGRKALPCMHSHPLALLLPSRLSPACLTPKAASTPHSFCVLPFPLPGPRATLSPALTTFPLSIKTESTYMASKLAPGIKRLKILYPKNSTAETFYRNYQIYKE